MLYYIYRELRTHTNKDRKMKVYTVKRIDRGGYTEIINTYNVAQLAIDEVNDIRHRSIGDPSEPEFVVGSIKVLESRNIQY